MEPTGRNIALGALGVHVPKQYKLWPDYFKAKVHTIWVHGPLNPKTPIGTS